MATYAIQSLISVPTNTDFSQKQYFAVNVASSGNLAIADAAADCLGILQTDSTNNQTASVCVEGQTLAAVSGTVAIGQPLQIASGGTLVAFTAGVIVAIALEAGVSGSVIQVLIRHNGAAL